MLRDEETKVTISLMRLNGSNYESGDSDFQERYGPDEFNAAAALVPDPVDCQWNDRTVGDREHDATVRREQNSESFI